MRQNDEGCARARTNQRTVDLGRRAQSRRKSMVDHNRLREVDTGMQSTSKEVTVYLNHRHYHVSSYLFPYSSVVNPRTLQQYYSNTSSTARSILDTLGYALQAASLLFVQPNLPHNRHPKISIFTIPHRGRTRFEPLV